MCAIEAGKRNKTIFNEGLIFTHRGISGPSALQISSYCQPERTIEVNLLPQNLMDKTFRDRRKKYQNKIYQMFYQIFFQIN